MKLHLVLAFTSLTLAGCTSMDAGQCRAANWYDIGMRDGMAGMIRTDMVYDDQCAKVGGKVDTAAYLEGWQDGHWTYEERATRDSTF